MIDFSQVNTVLLSLLTLIGGTGTVILLGFCKDLSAVKIDISSLQAQVSSLAASVTKLVDLSLEKAYEL